MGKCWWLCVVYVLTNVADVLQPDSIAAGEGVGKQNKPSDIIWGKDSAGTFSAYSDTICLISAEQSPTIWPTELAVRRVCNHRRVCFKAMACLSQNWKTWMLYVLQQNW